MVELERLTGMRPNEVIQISTGDLNTTGPVWEYTPPHHKTEHHEKGRVVNDRPETRRS